MEDLRNKPVDNAEGKRESMVRTRETVARVPRGIIVRPPKGEEVDRSIIQYKYYNSFNYSLLSEKNKRIQITLGVTSANPQEGKTLTATNLAVSFSLGYQQKTVLVDLNFAYPRLHQIFNTSFSPGLLNALHGEDIYLSSTAIDNLYVLTAGVAKDGHRNAQFGKNQPKAGVEHTRSFGEIIRTLQEEFDFIVVDMPTINSQEFPILFTNHLNGLLVVVELGRTKKKDIDNILRRLNKGQVLGLVFNRVRDGNHD